jgi:hypothetical protein
MTSIAGKHMANSAITRLKPQGEYTKNIANNGFAYVRKMGVVDCKELVKCGQLA